MEPNKLKILKELSKSLKLIVGGEEICLEKKDISRYHITDVENFWIKQIKIEEEYERRFTSILKGIFDRQEKEILTRLGKQYVGKGIEIKINIPFLLLSLKKENKKMAVAVTPLLSSNIKKTGQYALDEMGVPMAFADTTAVATYLDKYPMKFAESVNKTTNDRLKRQLVAGIAEGEGVNEISKRVSGIFKGATSSRTKTIARTEVSRATNFATVEGYKQSGVVEGKEWLTAFDERTCSSCSEMDGKVISLRNNYVDKGDTYVEIKADYDNVTQPPLHANCRCSVIPVLEPTEGLTKQNMDNIYEAGPEMKKEIDDTGKRISSKFKGSRVAKAPLKNRITATNKVIKRKGGYSNGLDDVARNTIVLKNKKDLDRAVRMLEKEGNVVKLNVYDGKGPLGYKGLNYKVMTKKGYPAEIQFNTPEMIWAKEKKEISKNILGRDMWNNVNSKMGKLPSGQGHKFYEGWRARAFSPTRNEIEKASKKYYKLVEKKYYGN